MAQKAWILRYGELGLKSRIVRRQFLRALTNNLEQVAINSQISIVKDRILTMEVVTSTSPPKDAENMLCHVLGVVAIDPAEIIAENIEVNTVAAAILAKDSKAGTKRTFGVRTRRLGPKGEYGSQDYCREIGSAMCEQDENLSVDLTAPDMWVRLVLEPERVWLMSERIAGAGGLPPGVQGDVLCRIVDEESLLSAFLIMRRGSRLIPIEGCNDELIAILKLWDPFIGIPTKEKTHKGSTRPRHPWGVVGMTVEEGEELISRKEDEKTTPLSTLTPLCGWTDAEKDDLLKHINDPLMNPCLSDIKAWVS